MKLSLNHWLLATAIAITVPTAASALDGAALDTSFGSGGTALFVPPLPELIDPWPYPHPIEYGRLDQLVGVFQVGDRYVAVGVSSPQDRIPEPLAHLWFARVLSNGALDKSFSPTGYAMHAIPGTGYVHDRSRAHAEHVSRTPEGKWLIRLNIDPESGPYRRQVWRLNADFSLDTSFGSDGVVDLPNNFHSYLGLTHMTGGRTLAVGERFVPGEGWRTAMVRIGANGAVEPIQDITGPHVASMSGRKIALLPDDSLLIAGSDLTKTTSAHFAAIRIRPDGTQDMGFGYSGLSYIPLCFGYTPDLQPWAELTSMVIDRSNRVVMAGDVRNCARNIGVSIGVARIQSTGYGDGTFLPAGGRTFDFMPASDHAYEPTVSLQGDGKLVISSTIWATSYHRCGISRLNENGALDPTFGQVGLPGRAIHYGACSALDMLLDEMTGRPVLFGWGAPYGFSITRLTSGPGHSPYPY